MLPMNKLEITQNSFNKLLNWLDDDKEAAALKYQSIHQRLVRIFRARKVFPAEELADRTMDIVIQKIDYLVKEYKGEPGNYFYSVAHNIMLEQIRKPKSEELHEKMLCYDPRIVNEDKYLDCLQECMQDLPPEQKKLLINYFKYKNEKKAEHHKKMLQELGLEPSTLRTKVYRLKMVVEKCVKKCVGKKSL